MLCKKTIGTVDAMPIGLCDSEKINDCLQAAVGDDRHDDRCENQSEEDRRNGFLSADMQQRRNQRACPCAGAGQRNADEQQQSDKLDLADFIRLFAGARLHYDLSVGKHTLSLHCMLHPIPD